MVSVITHPASGCAEPLDFEQLWDSGGEGSAGSHNLTALLPSHLHSKRVEAIELWGRQCQEGSPSGHSSPQPRGLQGDLLATWRGGGLPAASDARSAPGVKIVVTVDVGDGCGVRARHDAGRLPMGGQPRSLLQVRRALQPAGPSWQLAGHPWQGMLAATSAPAPPSPVSVHARPAAVPSQLGQELAGGAC